MVHHTDGFSLHTGTLGFMAPELLVNELQLKRGLSC